MSKGKRNRQAKAKAQERAGAAGAASWASMTHSFEFKLAWAERHIQQVEGLLAGWARDGYRTFEKASSEGRFVLYAEQLKPLPDEVPLVLGDTFQCLRNSLDHIIFAISKKNPAMTANEEHVPAFPISDRAVRDNAKAISFLEKAARDDVRDLAPDPGRQPLNQDPLWLLNKMSNRDKHREITVAPIARAGIDTYRLFRSDGSDYFHGLAPGRLEIDGEPVPLCEFARSPGVQAQIGHAVEILFDQGTEVGERQVSATLRWFHEHIRDTVFQRLEPHL